MSIKNEVEIRAKKLLGESGEELPPIERGFVAECLKKNERGDGLLFSEIHQDNFLLNVTVKDQEWYVWSGNIWEQDYYRRSINAVEDVVEEYEINADELRAEIPPDAYADKRHPDYQKVLHLKKYTARIDRLRSEIGAKKTITWAPIVNKEMACREDEFNQKNWLLPCNNGVIDLEHGVLLPGRPEDRMNKKINIDYDSEADYQPWVDFLVEVTDSEETANFLKRTFGYAATGFSYEQYIWLFLGPGRNGKGIIFNMISEVLGPFFHSINPGLLMEQKNTPSPSAASEHLYSLLHKRLIVGSETNPGKKIDEAAVKELTGEDEIVCRPNFGSEINFYPTHTLMLRTNNVPYGMTKDFALRERLLLIDLPFRYVDDVEEHKRKDPLHKEFFRKKDKKLKDKLRKMQPGILRWLVEGCQEWQRDGLNPPQKILDSVAKLCNEEDYIGRFIQSCLIVHPGENKEKIKCTEDMYRIFQWWWSQNEGVREKTMPAMKTVNKGLRERGFIIEGKSGITWVFGVSINMEIEENMNP